MNQIGEFKFHIICHIFLHHISLMNPQVLKTCQEITKSFISRAINVFFLNPVDPEMDDLPDYHKIVTNPMDLTTVETKLNQSQYSSPTQWYNDMCLIYENAIRYHTENSIWGIIAEQLLDDFKKAASGLNISNQAEWAEQLAKQKQKLGEVISNSPIKHGPDVLINGCIKRAEGLGRFPRDMIPELITRLNKLFERDEGRTAFFQIMKLTQKEQPVTPDEEGNSVVDVEKLKDHTLNAVSLFVQAIL
ncbi:Bromodomain containing protein [Tritrichomonas foetus]|uniref:Bromodomain containing protein n=1 Tax=Tritrichomonas foetus TaxID=1144522 RepID=A0A1J4J9S6_9EUKA|nr:Bromodomain containing protein [Tritrichomonas foetus]|eukprot:OHS95946.1 Bromodomain containing protein [Tritrichomonas foetus]